MKIILDCLILFNIDMKKIYLRMYCSFLFFVYLLQMTEAVDERKQQTLNILILNIETGFAATDAKSCEASINLAIDAANKRDDILPNYHLKPLFRDDGGADGHLTNEQVKKFIDNFSQSTSYESISPIIVGPTFGPELSARPSRFQNLLHFPVLGNAAILTEKRHIYSNLYRTTAPAPNIIPALFYVIEKIGKWKQISMLLTGSNHNVLRFGLMAYEHFNKIGIQVLNFNTAMDFNEESVAKVATKNTRIIALFVLNAQDCVNFLCSAWKLGMKPPYYMFVSITGCFFDLNTPSFEIPPKCSLEIIKQQMSITIIYGALPTPVMNHGPTSLGYDLRMFEMAYRKAVFGKNVTDDPRKYMCHDAMLATIMTLNLTATMLEQKNLSFSDFYEKGPEIYKIANEAATGLDVRGLRIGRIHYSSRLEVDDEPLWIMQMKNNSKIEMLNRIWNPSAMNLDHFDYETFFNLSNWQSIQLQAPTWTTVNGEAPKDLSKVIKVHIHLVFGTFIALSTLTIVLFVVKILGIVIMLAKIHVKNIVIANMYSGIGFLLLDMGTLVTLGKSLNLKVELCYAWLSLSIVGLSLISMSLFSTNIFIRSQIIDICKKRELERITKKLKYSFARPSKQPTLSCTELQNQQDQEVEEKGPSKNFHATIFTLPSIVLVVFLLFSQTYDSIFIETRTTNPAFSQVLHSYFKTIDQFCTSRYIFYFALVFFAVNGVVLIFSSFISYQNKAETFYPKIFKLQIQLFKICSLVTTSLFIAGVLCLEIVTESNSDTKDLAIVILSNLFSTTCFAILFIPLYFSIR